MEEIGRPFRRKTDKKRIPRDLKSEYYAHSSDDDQKDWQTIAEHLYGTATTAKEYASAFHAGDFGYLCGLMHDLGQGLGKAL